jgi:hypothetical protein
MPYYLADLISHWLVDLSLVRHRLPYRYDQNPIWCLYFAQGSYTPTSKIFPFYSQIIRLCQRCFQFWSGQSFITGRPHVHRFSHHSSFFSYFQVTLPIKSSPRILIRTYLHNPLIILPSKYPTSWVRRCWYCLIRRCKDVGAALA